MATRQHLSETAVRRLTRECKLIGEEREQLAARGIYFDFAEGDIGDVCVLIIPGEKKDLENGLVSPYTGGFFLFKFTFDEQYPFTPPKVVFHPQQNVCRLHPNYYQCGKVCISLINTWSRNDWSPNVSLMSVAQMLEERFCETALMCEPGVAFDVDRLMRYNDFVVYGKLKCCVVDILKGLNMGIAGNLFRRFKETLCEKFASSYSAYMAELDELVAAFEKRKITVMTQEFYTAGRIDLGDIKRLRNQMMELRLELGLDGESDMTNKQE